MTPFLVVLLLCFGCGGEHVESSKLRGPIKVVAFGDSLMSGYGLANPDEENFIELLRRRLEDEGHDIEMINVASAGHASFDAVRRVGRDVPEDADLVLLEFGTNDAARDISMNVLRRNIDIMIGYIQKRGAHVLLFELRDWPVVGARAPAEYNKIYSDLADKHDAVLVPFFMEGVVDDPALWGDRLHPNAKGQVRIAENVYPHLKRAIENLEQ